MTFDLHSIPSLKLAASALDAKAEASIASGDISSARNSWATAGLVSAVINDCEAEAGWQALPNSRRTNAADRRRRLTVRLAELA